MGATKSSEHDNTAKLDLRTTLILYITVMRHNTNKMSILHAVMLFPYALWRLSQPYGG